MPAIKVSGTKIAETIMTTSLDEKPAIQAIKNVAPELLAKAGKYPQMKDVEEINAEPVVHRWKDFNPTAN